MIDTKGPVIMLEALPPHLLAPPTGQVSTSIVPAAPPAPDLSLEAAERDQIRRALDAAGGRRIAAARLLGLSRRTHAHRIGLGAARGSTVPSVTPERKPPRSFVRAAAHCGVSTAPQGQRRTGE